MKSKIKTPSELMQQYDRERNNGKLAGLAIGSVVCLPVLFCLALFI